MQQRMYDFVAIGLGPFNLGLACLSEPVDGLQGVFLDERPGFDWHSGMMLPDAGMQTPFLADLVTLADPTSRYGFLNYLKASGRLYAFYIRESFFALRKEFNLYCQWAAAGLSNLRFNRRVTAVTREDGGYRVHACLPDGREESYLARRLVLGTGTEPVLPPSCTSVAGQATHSADYLRDKDRLQSRRSITLIGSGQSAAEIYHDLLSDSGRHGYRLDWITRSERFFPLEYGKLTLELTSPEYIDYFHGLAPERRDRLIASQKNLYKGINLSLINRIYDLLYRTRLDGGGQTLLLTGTELTGCRFDVAAGRYELDLFERAQQRRFRHRTEALILATGYRYRLPAFLQPVADRLRFDAAGRLDVARDYSVDCAGGEIFVQNVGLHTHGLATPDLGMACYRNACILRSLTGRDVYPVETRIAFQQFGLPETAPRSQAA